MSHDKTARGPARSLAVDASVDGPTAKALVGYFGLWQAVHVVVILRAFLLMEQGRVAFPASPPAGGWAESTQAVFVGMGGIDLVGALLAVGFVVAYVRERRSWPVLGAVALAIANYSAFLFAVPTWMAGAWAASPVVYWGLYASFLPIWALTVLYAWWGYRGALSGAG